MTRQAGSKQLPYAENGAALALTYLCGYVPHFAAAPAMPFLPMTRRFQSSAPPLDMRR